MDILPPVKPRYEHENTLGCLTKGYMKVLLSQVNALFSITCIAYAYNKFHVHPSVLVALTSHRQNMCKSIRRKHFLLLSSSPLKDLILHLCKFSDELLVISIALTLSLSVYNHQHRWRHCFAKKLITLKFSLFLSSEKAFSLDVIFWSIVGMSCVCPRYLTYLDNFCAEWKTFKWFL